MNPDEPVIDAHPPHYPAHRLPNGREVFDPRMVGPMPVWQMFVDDADRVIAAFGKRVIEMALAMVRA